MGRNCKEVKGESTFSALILMGLEVDLNILFWKQNYLLPGSSLREAAQTGVWSLEVGAGLAQCTDHEGRILLSRHAQSSELWVTIKEAKLLRLAAYGADSV